MSRFVTFRVTPAAHRARADGGHRGEHALRDAYRAPLRKERTVPEFMGFAFGATRGAVEVARGDAFDYRGPLQRNGMGFPVVA